MPNNDITIVVSAPSGAGKTTIIKRLLEKDGRFAFAVSTTTRPMRQGEKRGGSYYFVSREEFREKIDKDEFLEWAVVHQNYYGTSKKEVDRIGDMGKIPIFDLDVQGARSVLGKLDGAIYVFIIPPSIDSLKKRLAARGTDSEEQIRIRFENAIRELREYPMYDYIIVNENVERAVDDLEAIVQAELCRRHRRAVTIKHILEDQSDNTAG